MNPQSDPSTMPQSPSPQYGRPGHYGARSAPPVLLAPPSAWSRVPVVYWVALGIGAIAFVVHLSYQQSTSGSAGYSCTYTDVAGYLAAAVIVVLTVVGWVARGARQVVERLPVPLMVALTVLLLALAFVHALRGSGTIMSPCDAHPVP